MKSLAQFVQERREKLGMSASGLANRAHLPLSMIEDIEAGKELFLPATVRQNLAKGLKCALEDIKYYEKDFDVDLVSMEVIDVLKERILMGDSDLTCPKCGAKLITRIAKMYDLEDNLMLHPKAHCEKCVFQIKD